MSIEVNFSDDHTEAEIIQTIENIGTFKGSQIEIQPRNVIVRARFDKKPFVVKDKSELRYRHSSLTRMNRANPEGYPVFYGSSLPSLDHESHKGAVICATRETSGIFRGSTELEKEYGFYGNWIVEKPLMVYAAIMHDYGGKYVAPEIAQMQLHFRNQLFDQYSDNPEAAFFHLEINKIIAELFARPYKDNDPKKYTASSVVAHVLMDRLGLDGIIYPTVQAEASAFNIALKASAADTLSLNKVNKINIHKQPDGDKQVDITHTSKEVIDGKILSWVELDHSR